MSTDSLKIYITVGPALLQRCIVRHENLQQAKEKGIKNLLPEAEHLSILILNEVLNCLTSQLVLLARIFFQVFAEMLFNFRGFN